MGIRNFFDRMIVAREKQAKAYVNSALWSLDDETLKSVGVKRENLKRTNNTYPF